MVENQLPDRKLAWYGFGVSVLLLAVDSLANLAGLSATRGLSCFMCATGILLAAFALALVEAVRDGVAGSGEKAQQTKVTVHQWTYIKLLAIAAPALIVVLARINSFSLDQISNALGFFFLGFAFLTWPGVEAFYALRSKADLKERSRLILKAK